MKKLTLIIEIAVLAFVGLLPLALAGAAHPFLWTVAQLGGAALLFLLGLRALISRRLELPVSVVGLLLLGFLGWGLLQMVPLPFGALSALSPEAAQTHRDIHQIGSAGDPDLQNTGEAAALPPAGPMPRRPLSVSRADTRVQWFAYVTYFALFFAILSTVRQRDQVLRFATVLVLSMTAAALLGIAQEDPINEKAFFRLNVKSWDRHPDTQFDPSLPPAFSAGYGRLFPRGSVPRDMPLQGFREGDRLTQWLVHRASPTAYLDDTLWIQEDYRTPDLLGPFPTRDAMGAFINLCLPIAIAYLAGLLAIRRTDWGPTGGLLQSRDGNMTLLLFLVIGVALLLLLLYGSWVTLLILTGQALFFVLIWLFRKSITKQIVIAAILIAATLAAGAIAMSWKPVEPLDPNSPLEGQTSLLQTYIVPRMRDFIEQRNLGWQAAQNISADYRMTGTGLGTFSSVYPRYAPGHYGRVMLFAGSYPLSLLAETGLIGAALIAIAVLAVVVRGFIAHFRIDNILTRRIIIGLVTGLIGAAIAASMGYEMNIAGFAAPFWATLAIAYVLSCGRFERYEKDKSARLGAAPQIHAPHSFTLRQWTVPGGRMPAIALGVVVLAFAVGFAAYSALIGWTEVQKRSIRVHTADYNTTAMEFQRVATPGFRAGMQLSYDAANRALRFERWSDELHYRLGHLRWMMAYPPNIELGRLVTNYDIDNVQMALMHTHQAANSAPLNPVYHQTLAGLYRFLAAHAQQRIRDGAPAAEMQPLIDQYIEAERHSLRRLERLAPRHPLLASRQLHKKFDRIQHIRSAVPTAPPAERDRLLDEGRQLVDETRALLSYYLEANEFHYFRMGMFLLRDTRAGTAALQYDDYARMIPETANGHALAAEVFRGLMGDEPYANRQEDKAIRAATLLLSQGKQTPETYFILGRIYRQRGELLRASDHLTLAAIGDSSFEYLIEAANCTADYARQITAQLRDLGNLPAHSEQRRELNASLEKLTQRILFLLRWADRKSPAHRRITELRDFVEKGYVDR